MDSHCIFDNFNWIYIDMYLWRCVKPSVHSSKLYEYVRGLMKIVEY